MHTTAFKEWKRTEPNLALNLWPLELFNIRRFQFFFLSFQRFQIIEFVDRPVLKTLDIKKSITLTNVAKVPSWTFAASQNERLFLFHSTSLFIFQPHHHVGM